MNGLSDRAQAIVLLIASALIGASGIVASLPSDIPQDARPYVALFLLILGAVGFALKEALGSPQPTPTTPQTNTPKTSIVQKALSTFRPRTRIRFSQGPK